MGTNDLAVQYSDRYLVAVGVDRCACATEMTASVYSTTNAKETT